MAKMTIGDREQGREGAAPDCYEKHREWTLEQWENEMLPKVKNLVYLTLGGVAVIAVSLMVGVAKYQVYASEHATVQEVKEVEIELKQEIRLLKEEIQHDLDTLNKLHVEGFRNMEQKMDSNFKDVMDAVIRHDNSNP